MQNRQKTQHHGIEHIAALIALTASLLAVGCLGPGDGGHGNNPSNGALGSDDGARPQTALDETGGGGTQQAPPEGGQPPANPPANPPPAQEPEGGACTVTHAQIEDGELRVALSCLNTGGFTQNGNASFGGISKAWPTWTQQAPDFIVVARHDTSVRPGVVTLELDDVGNFTAPASDTFRYTLAGIGSGSKALAFDAAGLPTTPGVAPYPDDGI